MGRHLLYARADHGAELSDLQETGVNMKTRRISKKAHAERMGDRAARRAEDARFLAASSYGSLELERLREARRKNGVGRPPRRAA
jgi:hypothetical protein